MKNRSFFRRIRVFTLVAALLVAASLLYAGASAQQPAPMTEAVAATLNQMLAEQGRVSVIVGFDAPVSAQAATDAKAAAAQQGVIDAARSALIDRVRALARRKPPRFSGRG